jgi:hypothetical protein
MGRHRLMQFRPMDKAKAQAWIEALAKDLKVFAPRLDWNPREKNGSYSFGTIHVGPRTWRGLDCLLHEFAHHVARRVPTPDEKMYGRGRRHHGTAFYASLITVVDAVERLFGHEYDWLTEYRTLRRRRLTDSATARRKAAGSAQGAPVDNMSGV